MSRFIQLGDVFINPDHIVYVDFSDQTVTSHDTQFCILVLRSIDKEDWQGQSTQTVVSEEMKFYADKPEYWALKTWLKNNCEVLVPQKSHIVEQEAQ